MKKAQFFISLILLAVLVLGQAAVVLAAPARADGEYITGRVQKITLETDTNTGVTTVVVTIQDKNKNFQVRLSVEIASDPHLALVAVDEDGNPVINEDALGQQIEIDLSTAIPEEQHPVGSALATFFDMDYQIIMDSHEAGNGFGVITQALWLSEKIAGEDATAEEMEAIFLLVMQVKRDGSYQAFYDEFLPDEQTIPTNWGQFRKSMLDGNKTLNLGTIMSQKENKTDNGHPTNTNSSKDKNKDKTNNGKGNDAGNGGGNGKKP